MKDSKDILAIIIPVFNGLDYTRKCLANLNSVIWSIDDGPSRVRIILVDDGSSDGTSGWVKKKFPHVHVLQGDGNLWWSGGINLGSGYAFKELHADRVLWWNNDVQSDEKYLSRLLSYIDGTDHQTIIGSKVFVIGTDLIWGMGGIFNPSTGMRKNFAEMEKDSDNYRKPVEVDWFPGMGTTIPKKVYDSIGYLDEKNFPQYHGDSDFTYRAKKAGFKLIAFPDLIIYNDNSNTGLIHKGSIRLLFRSLTSIKSNYNFAKDFSFYRKHATTLIAYSFLFKRYLRYTGGFFKWKILQLFGIRKV